MWIWDRLQTQDESENKFIEKFHKAYVLYIQYKCSIQLQILPPIVMFGSNTQITSSVIRYICRLVHRCI